ncbi:MAG: carbohydrate kinase family protein [Planctomycetota bacterium]
MNRTGIAAGGNWIVDRVKTVDCLPGRGMLANIRREEVSTGGAPANVLADLARMGAAFPLTAVGMVGADRDGEYILNAFRRHGIDVSHLATTDRAATSYTDVMTDEGSGARTFYHHRGANALFAPEHVPVDRLTCRLFHLGYLLLLDEMDKPDAACGTRAARLLAAVQKAGIKTSVDVVSEESDRFRTVVPHALAYVNYLILNEIETGRITGRPVRLADGTLDAESLAAAVGDLCRLGKMDLVAVHMPEGFHVREKGGACHWGGSLVLPDGYIAGTVGAGDAFCAGMLHGLHEGWDCRRSARLATCCAAACLANANASDGLMPLKDVLELGQRFPEREPPVRA